MHPPWPERAIVGFHQDDEQHWVAQLACGHNQHVRHDLPWTNRPWVISEAGREQTLGQKLVCKKCDPRPVAIPLPDADISFISRVELGLTQNELLKELINTTTWRSEEIRLFGKTYPQPRLTAWYGDPGKTYTYSGLKLLEPLPWTDTLTRLRVLVEAAAGVPFNSVLLNYYRNQNDSMGMHSDDEKELGERPVIASLSLGAARTLVFKHKKRKDLAATKLLLETGSLLIMRGETQRFWKHGVGKEKGELEGRVSLTFRGIV